MPCCTEAGGRGGRGGRGPRWRRVLLPVLALLALAPASPGLTAKDSAPVTLAEIEEYRSQGIPAEKWPALLEVLGSEENGRAVRGLLLSQTPFPAVKLVEMLVNPKLVVRLGALDLLEDAAGETFAFDPWSDPPAGGANAEALARWQEWAAKGAAPRTTAAGLSAESFRTLAMEIVSGQRERAERAMQRLEAYGPLAIGRLEVLLKEQPTLEEGARASLKMAQYRVLLRTVLPKQAAALARQLATGNPDMQATAVGQLAEGGIAAVPIIADFLQAPDPLVRETAVDAVFKAAETQAVELALPLLKTEKAESVLHALLRNLGEKAGKAEQAEAIAPFLEHLSENVAITAADALGRSKVGNVSAALAARLGDARWRVRAAAIEAIGKRRYESLSARVEKAMDDPDQFVRVTAAQSYHQLEGQDSHAILLARFSKQNELRSTIVQLFLGEDKAPPEELWTSLAQAPPAIILECLDSLEDRFDHQGKRVAYASRFSSHPNPDVAAAALRLLSGYGQQLGELLKALKSKDPAQRDAVLDQLHLPAGFLQSVPAATPAPATGGNSTLDRLYSALGGSAGKSTSAKTGGADPREFRQVLEGFFRDGSPRQRFRAALVLASQGDAPSAQFLLTSLPTSSGLDRRSIAGAMSGLSEWPPGPIRELMTAMLADPANDVREAAIQAWLEVRSLDRATGLLAELRRPGSLLKPDDVYGWEFDRAIREREAQPMILQWAQTVLGDEKEPGANKVMAILLLGRSGQAGAMKLERYLDADNPWLRRAAYRALGAAFVEAHLPAVLHDDSAMVRAVVPFLASPHSNGWLHWFDDAHSASDHEDYDDRYSSSSRRTFGAWAGKGAEPVRTGAAPSATWLTALEQLTHDPSDLVRFEALFALMRLGQPIEPEALAALVPAQPEENQVRYRLGQFLNNKYTTLGKNFGVLVPMASRVSEENRGKIDAYFGLERGKAPLTFAALAQTVSLPVEAESAAPPPPTPAVAAPGRPFRVIFFHKAGCRDCERAREMLAEQSQRLPNVVLEERDMAETQSVLLNEALAARFHVPDLLHQVTPAVFTQAGPLLREEITFSKLGDLLRQAATLEPNEAWLQVEKTELQTAQTTIEQRYEALSLSVVIGAGLLDGINPCAIATIIFLLSYLQIARRSPAEILAVGAAFVVSVFVTYLGVGLGMAEVLARLAAIRFAGTLLNFALAAFTLLLAVLSFRDAALAARGQAGEMTLQLPEGLKSRIRSVIRSGARTSRFVLAALMAGVVVSLLELACTGQVYLPTIQYMLGGGRKSAVGALVLYNTAFILPLAIVFGLAWAGLRSEALVRWQQRHTAVVKGLTGVLFLGLTLLLVYQYRPVS